jgi:hypothetical protein
MFFQLAVLAVLAVSPFATYGVMKVKMDHAVSRADREAYKRGEKAGAAQAATKTLEAAQNTLNRAAEGERMAEPVPAEKQKLIELCNRSASCRDRKKGGV